MSFCLGIIEVDTKVLNDAYVNNKQHFNGFGLQRKAYYKLRDEIHYYVKTCADNVKLIIYVDDVLEQPIVISAGKVENEVHITIRIDGTLAVKWTKETCSYETNIMEVNVRTLDDVLQRFMHRFRGIEPQRQAFYDVRDKIHDLVKTCADNVQIFLNVNGVLDKPIVISAGKLENKLHITIKIDGTLAVEWEKEACSYEIKMKEVNFRDLDDVFQSFKHRFTAIEAHQIQSFYDVRDKIHDLVKTCAGNVQIVVNADAVLDKPISISAGKMKNEVHITINMDGIVNHNWIKKTVLKRLREVWDWTIDTFTKIIGLIGHLGILAANLKNVIPKTN